jgi:hypothetical protein
MGEKASSEAKAMSWSGRLGRAFGPDSPTLRMGVTIVIVTASIVIALITS